MGAAITDTTTADVLHQLNSRFSDGGPLQEMVVIQREFRVFSEQYSLVQAFRLLHIVPADFKERRFWFIFLDALKTYASDQEGMSGHDRIVHAYRENLESEHPLPVYTTVHRASEDNRVTVGQGRPIIYDPQEHVVISIPTTPAAESARAARVAARKKRVGQ